MEGLHRCRSLFYLGVLCMLAACTSWQDVRREVVDPVNTLVHVDYPKRLKVRDVEAVTNMFAPQLRDWAKQDIDKILGKFEQIDRLRCVIHDASAPNADGEVRTDCVLRVDGLSEGKRLTWEQERKIVAGKVDGRWYMTKVETGLTNVTTGGTVFKEEAEQRGLIATNHTRGAPSWSGETQPWVISSGIAVGDIDGDDDDDVLLISGDKLRLFTNDKGQFTNVTETSGIRTPDTGDCRCGYFADIDNDGDQDLFVAMFRGRNLLFQNQGDGTFVEILPKRSGLTTKHGNTAAAVFGDFDGDGDLDLVLANGNDMYTVHPDPEDNARNGHPDQYFRNRGDGTFEEATNEVGLGGTGWALTCAASDYDKDGDLDIFVANDVGEDFLYRNRGDGTFEDVTHDAGCAFVGSSMSADFGDVDGDGWPDLYVSGMASNSRWMMRQPAFPLPVPFPIDVLFRKQVIDVMWEMFHGNRLYLNNRDGTFREVSTETRSYWFGWGWSAAFLDYDNDGMLDIYGANGFWTGAKPADC